MAYLRHAPLAFVCLFALAEEPPREFVKEVRVKRGSKLFAGYDLTGLPKDSFVKLILKVMDDEAAAGVDFVDKSGKASTGGGDVSWGIINNDIHLFEAHSNPFRRSTVKYSVFTHGLWQVPGVGGGKPAVWEVSVVHPLIAASPGQFPDLGKMLATARHSLRASLVTPPGREPEGTWRWTYPGGGGFEPNDRPQTAYTAPEDLTPADERDLRKVRVEFRIADGGDVTADDRALNITAPKKFSSPQDAARIFNRTYGLFNSNDRNATTELIDTRATFLIFDQFGDRITQSDRGDKHVQIKEDLPWGGFAADWARDNVGPTQETFRNRDTDSFTDEMKIGASGREGGRKFPIRALAVQEGAERGRLVPALRSNGAVVLELNTHTWHATVSENEALDTPFSASVFRVVITEFQPARPGSNVDRFKLQSTYDVVVIPEVKK